MLENDWYKRDNPWLAVHKRF